MQAYLRQVLPGWQNGSITTVMKSEEEAQRAIRISLEVNFEAGALHFRVLIFFLLCTSSTVFCSDMRENQTQHPWVKLGQRERACVCAQESDFEDARCAHFGERVQSKIWPQSSKKQKLSTERQSHSWIYFVKIVQMRPLF